MLVFINIFFSCLIDDVYMVVNEHAILIALNLFFWFFTIALKNTAFANIFDGVFVMVDLARI